MNGGLAHVAADYPSVTRLHSDGMDATVVGIGAFLDDGAPRTSLRGVIKTQPTDFVVQEITLEGHVLALDTANVERLPTQHERDAVVQVMSANRTKQRTREPLVFDDPPGTWREELQRLLRKDEMLARLERVATGQDNEHEPCLIDAPSEFRDRVYLQICIQHCFPSVDCKLLKTEDTNTQYIHVVKDGMYKKFRSADISDENATRLVAFIRKGATHADAAQGIVLAHEDTKEARTALHRQISMTSNTLKTRTETRDGKQCLVVGFSPHTTKKRKRGDQPPEPFVRFVLQKTNLEHFTCFERLARVLKRPVSAFATAGTKDKVAVTYQHVTVQGVPPQRLLELNREFNTSESQNNSGLRVSHVEYTPAPMALGGLTGNRFTIIVRDLPTNRSDTNVQERLEHVKKYGFLNYFGFQRVGLPTSSVRPHQIGELIVAGKWEAAVRKIFTPSNQDSPECAAAKAAFQSKDTDVDAVLKLIPHNSMQVERSILMGLKRHGSLAWEAAIRSIAYGRRTMYLHAYQSYLFNMLVSHRIKQYGTKVVEGDLVRERAGDSTVVIASAEKARNLNTKLEYPLSCVVLPLPGSNVLRPTNKTGDLLQQLLDEHGTAATLKESTDVKGDYRALIETPRDVDWQRVEDDANAIQIQFSLSSGCFATMCLRQILRYDL